MDFLSRGHMLADVSAIIGSLDIVFGRSIADNCPTPMFFNHRQLNPKAGAGARETDHAPACTWSTGHEKNRGLRGDDSSRLDQRLSRSGRPREKLAEPQQWSELCLTTQRSRKFGAPIRARHRADRVRMPVLTPGREVTPSLTEPKE